MYPRLATVVIITYNPLEINTISIVQCKVYVKSIDLKNESCYNALDYDEGNRVLSVLHI